jgi:hypothetical protein
MVSAAPDCPKVTLLAERLAEVLENRHDMSV